jgi:nucleotide-binding universal stress UspA family protein
VPPTSAQSEGPAAGPVLFAYDGSELAAFAIEEAGGQLATGRDAVVVCIWQPAEVGFLPTDEQSFDALNAGEVRKAADETAAHGAALAQQAGFRSQSMTAEAAPTWKGIVNAAKERDASLIVLGSHRRAGLSGHLLGSVAAAVVAHSTISVLVVHRAG